MNRWIGTAHLTRDPELVATGGGTEICVMRIAVKRAARDRAGYFDVKAFGDQGAACAQYLKSGRHVAIEGRLHFEEFDTTGGEYASRVYIVADSVEFLNGRRRDRAQADNGQEGPDPTEPAGDAVGDPDADRSA